MKLKLNDTVELMKSSDYRDRFVAEYIQLKIRYERLKDFNTRIEAARRTAGLDNGVDEPEHDCPAGLLREQQAAMGEYLHLLEVRAKIEDIDLEDAMEYLSDKKRDRERKVIDETATVANEQREIYEELPDGVMSLEDTIEVIMKCEENEKLQTCDGCKLYGEDCRRKIRESSLYHLVKYAKAK